MLAMPVKAQVGHHADSETEKDFGDIAQESLLLRNGSGFALSVSKSSRSKERADIVDWSVPKRSRGTCSLARCRRNSLNPKVRERIAKTSRTVFSETGVIIHRGSPSVCERYFSPRGEGVPILDSTAPSSPSSSNIQMP